MNMLTDGATWLADQLQSHVVTSVIVRRDNTNSAAINATRTDTTYEVIDDDGYRHEARFQDWIFTATHIVVGGVQIRPRAGDIVLVGTERYDVTSTLERPAVEDFDADGVMLLVHSVKVV